jgi:hypothetical protein
LKKIEFKIYKPYLKGKNDDLINKDQERKKTRSSKHNIYSWDLRNPLVKDRSLTQ